MPGIPFLDAIVDYQACCLIDGLIRVIQPLLGLLTLGFFGVEGLRWGSSSLRGRVALAVTHALLFVLCVFSVLYGLDGRYSKQDISPADGGHMPYFGQITNGMSDGFGKLFDGQDRIVYVGGRKAGQCDGYGTEYAYAEDGTCYVKYQGSFVSGKREGEGTAYAIVAGKARESYAGGFMADERDGRGRSTTYYDDGTVKSVFDGSYVRGMARGQGIFEAYREDGSLSLTFEGCWFNSRRYGYGVQVERADGEARSAYRGLWWADERHGEGVWEYYNAEEDPIVWHGICSNDERTQDGAYYMADGRRCATEANGTKTVGADGSATVDDELVEKLSDTWPFPERLLLDEGRASSDKG